MAIVVVIAFALAVAVLACGREAVAEGVAEGLQLAARFIGSLLLLCALIGALYWFVHALKISQATPITKTETIFLISYLLGSIPFGLLLTRFAGFGDIRHIGSGNIGATNVLRTGNRELAALTLLMDGTKGMIAVMIAQIIHPWLGPLAGLLVLIGHMFPVWLEFKGGKGVATAIGVLLALSWPIGLAVIIMWLLIAALFRYSSLAAIVSLGLSPLFAYLLNRPELIWLTVAIVFLVVCRHHANLDRLFSGTEPRIGEEAEPSGRAKGRRRRNARG